MLRSDQWFPRWSPISVHFDAPIQPAGSDFAAVLQLRDQARAAILRHCGEPDLGGLAKPAAPPRDARPDVDLPQAEARSVALN